MFKKLFAVVLALTLLASCGTTPPETSSDDVSSNVTTSQTPTSSTQEESTVSEPEEIKLTTADCQNIAFDEANVVLSFAAMSDVHIDSEEKNTAATLYEKAVKRAYELTNNKLDMVFIAGDVTQNLMYDDKAQEKMYEITAFKKFTDEFVKKETSFLFCTGNHDRSSRISYEKEFYEAFTKTAEDKARYFKDDVVEDCEYLNGNRHAVVNGYHFLSVGMNQDYNAYLKPILDKLTKEDPYKPVFVQYHFHAQDTVYETFYNDSTEQSQLKTLLSFYPQVVYFSGHTHNSAINPRAIWQGTFTAFDTGSVRELCDESTINYKVGIPVNVTHAESRSTANESTLVEVDKNNHIRFTVYNVYSGKEVAQYTIAAPNKDRTHLLTYAQEREELSKAPVFENGADLKLSTSFSYDVEVSFNQAKHDDLAWYYTLTFEKDGEEAQKFYFSSRSFDPEGMPDKIKTTLFWDINLPDNSEQKGRGHNLKRGETYTATLTAYDVWDHPSESVVVTYKHNS